MVTFAQTDTLIYDDKTIELIPAYQYMDKM